MMTGEEVGLNLSTKDKLPREVNPETDSGQFAKSVISLVEDHTGIPILSDPSRLGLIGHRGPLPTLIGISKDGSWMITGNRNQIGSDKRVIYNDLPPGENESVQYAMSDVPLIEITISRVTGLKDRKSADPVMSTIPELVEDQQMGKLKIRLIGEESKGYKGEVSYTRPKDGKESSVFEDLKQDKVEFGSITGQNRVELSGNPPGIKKTFLDGLNKRLRPDNHHQKVREDVPSVVGWYIDQLPPKSKWDTTPKGITDFNKAYIERQPQLSTLK